jgi:hypothetical protein
MLLSTISMGRRTVRNTHQEAEEYLDACRQNQDVAWSCYYDGYVTSQTAATDKFEAYKCKAMDKLNEAGAHSVGECVRTMWGL